MTGAVYAQNSPGSVIPAKNEAPDVAELSKLSERALMNAASSAIAEIKAGRAYIKELEALTDAQKKLIADQGAQISLLQQIVAAKTEENKALRSALDKTTDALNKSSELIAEQKARTAKLEGRVGFWRKVGAVATIVAVVAVKAAF